MNIIPLGVCVCVCVCLTSSLSICWQTLQLFPCLYYCNTAINMGVFIFLRYLFEMLISFLWIPRSETLDHMAIPFLIPWRISILFSMTAVPIYISNNSAHQSPGSLFCTSTPLLVISCLFMTAFLWSGVSLWLCTTLMISDTEQLFMYLLAIFIGFGGGNVYSVPRPIS